jgi:NAD(P)-dependent dehydrogenase (short-subunit alcohol dehydrogenase family)
MYQGRVSIAAMDDRDDRSNERYVLRAQSHNLLGECTARIPMLPIGSRDRRPLKRHLLVSPEWEHDVQMTTDRRVALIAPAQNYVGPALARLLAQRGYNLVLAEPTADLVTELAALGAQVVAVGGRSADGSSAGSGAGGMGGSLDDVGAQLVEAALGTFGTYHSAFFSSGRIALGKFARMSLDDLRSAMHGNVELPFAFAQSVLPHLVKQGDGQVLVATSATALRPTPSASVYAATRSAATVLLQSAALEIADANVQLNVVGTNFMDFPEFLRGNRVETPEDRARVESMVPMKRLGTMEEFASFCATFLDASSRFATGQFFPYAGGWSR